MRMGPGKMWWCLLVLLVSGKLGETDGSPTGVSGGFVLGAQWFVKNQNEGANGQYLTTEYKDKVVKVGFEKVSDKVSVIGLHDCCIIFNLAGLSQLPDWTKQLCDDNRDHNIRSSGRGRNGLQSLCQLCEVG